MRRLLYPLGQHGARTWLNPPTLGIRPPITGLASHHPHLAHLRIHDLRHTAASLAISAGGSIMAIQRMLGHKDASMTLDRYGHLYNDNLIELATKLEAKFLAA